MTVYTKVNQLRCFLTHFAKKLYNQQNIFIRCLDNPINGHDQQTGFRFAAAFPLILWSVNWSFPSFLQPLFPSQEGGPRFNPSLRTSEASVAIPTKVCPVTIYETKNLLKRNAY